MGESAPDWLWLVALGLMPATVLVLWLLTWCTVPDSAGTDTALHR